MTRSTIVIVALLVGCEPEPPPAIDDVDWSAASGQALLILDQGVVTLDGQRVGELREPGVLRQSRHRKLQKALQLRSGQDPSSHDPPEQALLSRGWTLRVEVAADTPWDDVYPLLATASWVGFGPFELVQSGADGRSFGPLATDARMPASWNGEPILGVQPAVDLAVGPSARCAELHFEVIVEDGGDAPLGGLRQLPHALRTLGEEALVDCASMYADDQALRDVCLEAQRPDGQAFSAAEGLSWPPGIPLGQRSLGLDPALGAAGGRVVVAPHADTSFAVVLDALLALRDSEPVIALTKPSPSEDASCPEVKLRDASGVARGGARWLGEHHRPLR